MDNNETVQLIISGKSYPKVSKGVLTSNSEYFRALFSGNFCDSTKKTVCFQDLSTLAFDILFGYLQDKTISWEGKSTDLIGKVLAISDMLCIDSFLHDLRNAILSSYNDNKHVIALLNIENEYAERCYETFEPLRSYHYRLSRTPVVNDIFNYGFLITVTSLDKFWNFGKIDNWDGCYQFFTRMISLIELVLCEVLKNPPHLKKMRILLKNINLESLPWNNIKMILNPLQSEAPHKELGTVGTRKCRLVAIQHHFNDLRQEIGKLVSCIRVCYASLHNKISTFGILEFRLDTWLWEIKKEFTMKFKPTFCVMVRDHINLFGHSGLMTLRIGNRSPSYFPNIYISEISKFVSPYARYLNRTGLSTCALGRSIYIFVEYTNSDGSYFNSKPKWLSHTTLFRIDVFNHHFEECAAIPLLHTRMVADRTIIYLGGFCPHVPQDFKIFSYNVVSGEIRMVVELKNLTDTSPKSPQLVIKCNLVYVFFGKKYFVVDITKGVHQTLDIKTLECFFTQGWGFEILQLCVTKDGITFILDIRHQCQNCNFLGLMIAHLNTDTNVFRSLGFLPNPVQAGKWFLLKSPLQVQIDLRTPKSPKLQNPNEFVDGIKDLQNGPHKNSCFYY